MNGSSPKHKQASTKSARTASKKKPIRVMAADGTMYLSSKKGLFVEKDGKRRRISAPIQVIAAVNAETGNACSIRVRFKGMRGERVTIDVPQSYRLHHRQVAGLLLDHGLQGLEGGKDTADLTKYIFARPPKTYIRLVSGTGWHSEKHPNGSISRHFIFGSDVVGEEIEGFAIELAQAGATRRGARGSLEEWRVKVGALCRGNPILMLAVSSAFAGPLLTIANMEADITHIYGPTTTGKTTTLNLFASIYGDASRERRSWSSTSAGMEAVAFQAKDLVLPLDEIGQASAAEVSNLVYMLGNGLMKSRARRDMTPQAPGAFRTKVFSTGESSLAEFLARSNKAKPGGLDVRLFSVPARQRYGVFEEIHDFADGARFAEGLDAAMHECHGAVGREYLRLLCARRPYVENKIHQRLEYLQAKLLVAVEEFQPTEAEQRVVRRAALTAFAGQLATKFGLTGWTGREVRKAIVACMRLWLSNRRATEKERDALILSELRLAFQACQEDFVGVADERPKTHGGYLHELKRNPVYLVLPAYFVSRICTARSVKECTRVLRANDLLIGSNRGQDTKQVRVGGGKPTFYVVRRSILEEAETRETS